MKLDAWVVRTSVLSSSPLLFVEPPRFAARSNVQPVSQSSFVHSPAVPPRIIQPIDETQLVRLKGNVHPLAHRGFDQGQVPDSSPMSRMLLVLQRSAEQEATLETLWGEQRVKDSPNYHNRLTLQQFGAADPDIQTVTDWLTRRGFRGVELPASRRVIECSGAAEQVRNAFHSEIHHSLTNVETGQASSSDPQIPTNERVFP